MNPFPLILPLNAAMAHEGSQSLWDVVLHSNLINFLIAVLLIAFIIKKMNVGGMLQHTRDQLKSEIESLENDRQQAELQLAELKKQTADLHGEVSRILGQARESAEAMGSQILDEAKRDAQNLIEASKRRIEVEHKAAASDIERRLLADALQDARLELTQGLSANDQKRSVEAFINELSQVK